MWRTAVSFFNICFQQPWDYCGLSPPPFSTQLPHQLSQILFSKAVKSTIAVSFNFFQRVSSKYKDNFILYSHEKLRPRRYTQLWVAKLSAFRPLQNSSVLRGLVRSGLAEKKSYLTRCKPTGRNASPTRTYTCCLEYTSITLGLLKLSSFLAMSKSIKTFLYLTTIRSQVIQEELKNQAKTYNTYDVKIYSNTDTHNKRCSRTL